MSNIAHSKAHKSLDKKYSKVDFFKSEFHHKNRTDKSRNST